MNSVFANATRALAAAALMSLASCKDATAPVTQITPDRAVVRPYEMLTLATGTARVTDATLTGTMGTVAISAARLTDSTISLVVPDLPVGAQEIRLALGGGFLVTSVQVAAGVVVTNPSAVVDTVAREVEIAVTAVESSLTTFAARGADTTVMRKQITALRARVQQWRADLAAASPADRKQVAAFFAANPQLSFDSVAGITSAPGGEFAGGGATCTDGAQCEVELEKTIRRLAVGMAIFAGGLIAAKSASWLGGLASKITYEGVTIVAAGVTLGYVFNGISEIVSTPVVPTAVAEGQAPAMDPSVAGGPVVATWTNGTPGALSIQAEYRSLTVTDLSSNPVAAGVAKAMTALQDIWNTIAAAIPFIDLPAPAFPASPARKVVIDAPAAQLRVTGASPSGFSATSAVQGTALMVTVQNSAQGKDHEVGVAVQFAPPGLPVQSVGRTVLVRPKVYGIASIAVAPLETTIDIGAATTFAATARDSSGNVMTSSMLSGRQPTWTSSATTIADINTTSGLATGKAAGSTTITAVSSGKQGSATLTVRPIPDSTAFYQAMVVGNWTAVWDCVSSCGSMTGFYQRDELVLRAGGTGNNMRTTYYTGTVSNYDLTGPNSIAVSWNVSRQSDGYWLNTSGFYKAKLSPTFASYKYSVGGYDLTMSR